MRKIFKVLKNFFYDNCWVILYSILTVVIIVVAFGFIYNISKRDTKMVYECTIKFQNGDIKTFVCDDIIFHRNFASITVDNIMYKISYENLEVKIYE